jgi:hypothetical protein
MSEEIAFPLQLWINTPEYKKLLDDAQEVIQQFHEEHKKKYGHSIYLRLERVNKDGEPLLWLNGRGFHFNSKIKASDALKTVLKEGPFGWYTINELKEFMNGTGRVVERSMWSCGFKKSQSNPSIWLRRKQNEKNSIGGAFSDDASNLANNTFNTSELERITSLLEIPADKYKEGKTYSLQAGKNNMIYVSMITNPFAGFTTESLGKLTHMLYKKSHIAPEQGEYVLKAKNILLQNEQKAMYIQALKEEKPVHETVWPVIVSHDNLYKLANSLASKLR